MLEFKQFFSKLYIMIPNFMLLSFHFVSDNRRLILCTLSLFPRAESRKAKEIAWRRRNANEGEESWPQNRNRLQTDELFRSLDKFLSEVEYQPRAWFVDKPA